MRKKLTVSLDAEVYDALYDVVGRGNISKFIENLVRPRVIPVDMSELEADYRAKAEEEARLGHALYENEAWEEWKEWYGPNGSLSDADSENEGYEAESGELAEATFKDGLIHEAR